MEINLDMKQVSGSDLLISIERVAIFLLDLIGGLFIVKCQQELALAFFIVREHLTGIPSQEEKFE